MIIPTIPKPLADGIYFAIRLDFEFTAEFSLVVGLLDGRYRPPDRRVRLCHPLESVLLGQKAIGEKLDQIAELVGVDRDWIDGFCDSINGVDARADGPYRDGYCLARWPELRRWIEPLAVLPKARGRDISTALI